MKKLSRNGFTLIELLAVIVILAVIALIATPIIMNVINDSKEGSAKDAMYGYVKAVELATVNTITATTEAVDGVYKATGGNLIMDTETLNVNFKGSKPEDNGYVSIVNGQVVESGLDFGGYCIKYDGSKAEVSTNCTAPTKSYIEGDIVYYNPETNKKCAAGEVNTTANAKTGCLKWNVITMGDTANKVTVDIMLDHNSTGKVAWNSTGTNTEMREVAAALQTDVSTWNATIKGTARLITGQEVANIGKDTAWNSGKYTGTVYPTSPWLYQNLSSSNIVEKPWGYWTSTADSAGLHNAWFMYYAGNLSGNNSASGSSHCGVRPVITILKSAIA